MSLPSESSSLEVVLGTPDTTVQAEINSFGQEMMEAWSTVLELIWKIFLKNSWDLVIVLLWGERQESIKDVYKFLNLTTD